MNKTLFERSYLQVVGPSMCKHGLAASAVTINDCNPERLLENGPFLADSDAIPSQCLWAIPDSFRHCVLTSFCLGCVSRHLFAAEPTRSLTDNILFSAQALLILCAPRRLD
jgi:hypothetical protein